ILYAMLLATPVVRPAWQRNLVLLRAKNVGGKLSHIFVAAILLSGAANLESWFHSNLLLLAGAVTFFSLWRLHRHRVALVIASLLPIIVLINIAQQNLGFQADSPWSWQLLLIGALLATISLSFGGILHLRPARRINAGIKRLVVYCFAILSYL